MYNLNLLLNYRIIPFYSKNDSTQIYIPKTNRKSCIITASEKHKKQHNNISIKPQTGTIAWTHVLHSQFAKKKHS